MDRGVSGVARRNRIAEFFETLVDFDAWDDATTCEKIYEVLAVVGCLAGGFVEENDAVDVFFEVICGKENIAVVAAVVESVRDV